MGHRPNRARLSRADAQRHQGDDGLTRQNRVLPTGEITAHPARGTLMGNRGILHDAAGRLRVARWRHPHWICCRLEFRGRRRPIMAPHAWTELFFLDEAVALAAGHRPCAECHREAYRRFLDAWQAATGERPRAGEIDRQLHAARLVPGSRQQATHRAKAAGLPEGVFILSDGAPHLVVAGALRPYRHDHYGPPVPVPDGEVEVLTPVPTVAALRAGYRPELHPSASGVRPASHPW